MKRLVLLGVLAMASPVGAEGRVDGLAMRDIGYAPPSHEPRPKRIVVFLDRDGEVADDGVRRILPAFAGTDKVWDATVACVRGRFAPFDLSIVTEAPARGPYIHAMFGGTAVMKDLDPTWAGVGPHNGELIPNASVYIFSEGSETSSAELCRTAAHEIGHPLGLDHSRVCSDIMSYCFVSKEPYRFQDVEARCGEYADRDCADGKSTQSSYRKLAALVGLRHEAKPEDPYDARTPVDPYDDRKPVNPYR